MSSKTVHHIRVKSSRWLVTTSLCSALALAGCATSEAPGAAGTSPRAAAETQAGEPALRAAAVESTKTQDYVAAAAYWGALYERNASDAETAISYSRALRQIGSVDQAMMVMQRSHILHPGDANTLAEYGKVLTAGGRPDQAVAMLTEAARKSPRDWTVLSALGVSLDQMGRYDEAQAKYNAALELSPDNPSVLTNLGLSYALTGDLDMAERTLRRAVANAKADAYARQNLAIVLGLKGEFDEAERLARADLPANVADGNIAYLRAMLSQPALWKKMEELDRGPETETPATVAPSRDDDKLSFLPPETDLSLY